ncbi:MAG: phosphonoacetate hydrolase [Gammaproteobacteria bacterium]|nr:phosphonoacetate hydrolase [Gammaproteobacteria bacterium]
MTAKQFELNGTHYQWPTKPIVVVCVDGGDPSYLEACLKAKATPTIARFMRDGFYAVADGSIPSFTCPNNMSIVTGSEPAVHGISGNFFLDPDTQEPVVMTGPELLRSKTILSEYARLGAKVVTITAKDKLRLQLQKGIELGDGNMSFSAQHAASCTEAENGIDNVTALTGMAEPDMYSAELSLFVLEAGVKLLERDRPDIMYLSLTDFIQHKYAPDEEPALAFYRDVDKCIARLAELGAIVGITADHGMNDKATDDGQPNVIWLQDHLDEALGRDQAQVICPITDPFVAHHGALGGLVRVYLKSDGQLDQAMATIRNIEGIESTWDRASAARVFQLPADREGDILVISDTNTCIGARASDHDLSGLEGHRLRTHGGLSESKVPFILSHRLNDAYWSKAAGGMLRSHQLFEFAINGTT